MNYLPMPETAWAMLGTCALAIFFFLRKDLAEYRLFKTLTDSAERRKHFRKWIVTAALLFGGGSLAGLALLGRLPALAYGGMPAEFVPVSQMMRPVVSEGRLQGLLMGFASAFVITIIVLTIVFRFRKKRSGKVMLAGDVEALLPRNGKERFWAVLIALNAGWCEELFFRLLLPLLLTLATGNVFVAFCVAIAVFGAVHLYQGIVGVLATAILGALFAAIYLATGNIWIAAAAHAFVDLNGLILQPLLRGYRGPSLPEPKAQ